MEEAVIIRNLGELTAFVVLKNGDEASAIRAMIIFGIE